MDARGFTKSAKWHDCDKAVLLRWHAHQEATAAVVRCLEERAPHVGLTWAPRHQINPPRWRLKPS